MSSTAATVAQVMCHYNWGKIHLAISMYNLYTWISSYLFFINSSVSVVPQNPFSHDPILVRPLPPQHGATVLGEVGVLVDRRAVAQLVLHAIDEEENRHQTFESSLHRAAAGEESDVEAKAMGQEGLMMFVNE